MGSGQSAGYPIQRLDSVNMGDWITGVCGKKKCGLESERTDTLTPTCHPHRCWGATLDPRKYRTQRLQCPDTTKAEHRRVSLLHHLEPQSQTNAQDTKGKLPVCRSASADLGHQQKEHFGHRTLSRPGGCTDLWSGHVSTCTSGNKRRGRGRRPP